VLVGALVCSGAWIPALAAQAAQPAAPTKRPQASTEDALPHGDAECGSLDNGNAGPYDYRDHSSYVRRQLNLVNTNHFGSGVQTLKGGQTTVYVLGDLDFILRHFPNHYPALQTVATYFLQGGQMLNFRTAECYFDRAMRFVPDDLQVRLLYAIYLRQKGRIKDAVGIMERALELSPAPSMELHYNIALLYIDAKQFDKANYHASVAYAMGHPLPGLRDKLQELGEWRPVPIQIDEKTGQPVTVAASTKGNP
jgi:tetratricopeptide (TPR) repeat protein